MAIEIRKKDLNRLLRLTRETAAGAAEAARAGAAIVGQRAEETLACAKLRTTIQELREDIDRELRTAGQLVYATHQGSPSDSDALQAVLERLDALHWDLDDAER